MRFLIVDDNPEDRRLIARELLKAFPDAGFEEVFRKEDFVGAVARGGFDAALTDYHLRWGDGLWALSTIKARFPDVPVVMVTGTGSEEVAVAGRRYLSLPLSERAIDTYVQKAEDTALDAYETLTNREREVLHLAAEGLTNAEIAEQLFISPRTVEVHRGNLMRKLGLQTQIDLVRYALRRGILPME